MSLTRSNIFRLVVLFVVIIAVVVASCLAVFYGFIRPQMPVVHEHETFIEQLALSASQRAAVEEIDRHFETKRKPLLEQFRATTRDLAALLESEDAYTDAVVDSIDRVHHVHGELQALSVQRYFAILEVLPEEKRPEFRRLAAETLSQPE